MPDFRQTGWIGMKRAFALILTASLMLLSLSGLAQAATTPAIKKAQTQAEALQNLIDQLSDEMSAAAEDYDTAQQQLESQLQFEAEVTRFSTLARRDHLPEPFE